MSLQADFELLSVDAVRSFVTSRRDEDLHLDFKIVGDNALNRDDRKSLAVALSGFANSDGGIIVWGVDARPNTDGVDCATALHPVADALLLLNRLNTLAGQSVSPLVDGVRHRVLALENGTGYCATLTPASDSGPHMAKGGEDRYFKRSGSGFYRMEHFDLEDMFGRRRRPVLRLQSRLVVRDGDDPSEEVHFALVNAGRASAKHAGFMCTFAADTTLESVSGSLSDQSGLNDGRPIVAYQESVGVVHPNGIASSVGSAILRRPERGSPLSCQMAIYCEHMQARHFSVILVPGTSAQV